MKTILLYSHYSGTPGGPVDKLYDYLQKDYTVYNVRHPLWPRTPTTSSIFSKNKLITFKLPAKIQYLLEGVATLIVLLRKFGKKIDLVICFDSLSFLQVFFIKRFLRINQTVFYNMDFSKQRFRNPFVNQLFHALNQFAYKNCDYCLSLFQTFLMDVDPNQKHAYKSYLVKSAVGLASINRDTKPRPNSLVYAGALDYGTVHFEPLLLALRKLKKEGQPVQIDLFGEESPEKKLRALVNKLKLQDIVKFKGVAENAQLVQEIFPNYLIGVAPYVSPRSKSAPDHAFLGDELTAKIVDYIASGLPVITTEINPGFKVVKTNQFGFLVETPEDWYLALKTLLTNKRIYRLFHQNALAYAKVYDIDTVFGPILNQILNPKHPLPSNQTATSTH